MDRTFYKVQLRLNSDYVVLDCGSKTEIYIKNKFRHDMHILDVKTNFRVFNRFLVIQPIKSTGRWYT